MNGIYEIYKLDSSGQRDSLLLDYEVLDATLNRSKDSEVTIAGSCTSPVPLAKSDRIAVVRNETQIFSGIVTEIETKCDDVENNLKSWEATVESDNVVLSWRYVFATGNNATPANIEVGEDVYDKIPNDNDEDNTASALNRMLYYIRKHAGANAADVRQVVTVNQTDDNTRGTQGRSAYHIKKLTEVIKDIRGDDELYPKVTTNLSGTRALTVPEVRETDLIVSPEFGNVSKWDKSEKYPKFNACWVLSGVYTEKNENDDTETETRVWVYAEDTESITQYGRIENVISKSDIRIVAADPDKPDVIPVTEAEVEKLLETEAQNQLKDAAASEKWTVTMIETNGCAFMDDWQLGDKVRCMIDGETFESIIETVKIRYSGGVETVTPTIGKVETGIYGELFDMVHGIDRRLKAEEEK